MTPESRTEDAKAALMIAIRTMRTACDEAEYRVNSGRDMACAVQHAFVWGLANATSHIEVAHQRLEDAHHLRLIQAQERQS